MTGICACRASSRKRAEPSTRAPRCERVGKTGETSTARVFVSGEATAISGVTVGVYLFRNIAALTP